MTFSTVTIAQQSGLYETTPFHSNEGNGFSACTAVFHLCAVSVPSTQAIGIPPPMPKQFLEAKNLTFVSEFRVFESSDSLWCFLSFDKRGREEDGDEDREWEG